jgi:hypothetical protein
VGRDVPVGAGAGSGGHEAHRLVAQGRGGDRRRRLSDRPQKAHPDVGGSREQMLTLTATADRLRAAVAAGLPTSLPPPPPPRRDGQRRARTSAYRFDAPPLKRWEGEGYLYCDDVYAAASTDRAVLCRFATGGEAWIPLSQLHETDNELWERGNGGRLVVSAWFATRKGWW